jgi:rare lipoprotein A (peptidoglycan hydrolase)
MSYLSDHVNVSPIQSPIVRKPTGLGILGTSTLGRIAVLNRTKVKMIGIDKIRSSLSARVTVAFVASLLSALNFIHRDAAFAEDGKSFSGNISWYGAQFNGRKTASGEKFDITKPTAAHRKLPFQTKVLVEDPKTGKSVVVKVNDRGPFVKTRVMDVSREGARRLGTLSRGVCYVDCTIISDD